MTRPATAQQRICNATVILHKKPTGIDRFSVIVVGKSWDSEVPPAVLLPTDGRGVQQTKLGVFCDKIIEAGWLLAAILAPLFFDVYSSRVFEPDKITLVRSIAVIMSAAWLVKVLESGLGDPAPLPTGRSHASRQIPWSPELPAATPWPGRHCSSSSAYLISTIFSVSQVVSLWGSYQRLQGTYSTFSYIVIFFLLVDGMRQREQVDRLITIMLFTSLPAALYGLVQHNKLEFLPWAGDVTTRVTSSMGNAIFIAAWLIMVVPLTLIRFLENALQLWSKNHYRPSKQIGSSVRARLGWRWHRSRASHSSCWCFKACASIRPARCRARQLGPLDAGPDRPGSGSHHPAAFPENPPRSVEGRGRRCLPLPDADSAGDHLVLRQPRAPPGPHGRTLRLCAYLRSVAPPSQNLLRDDCPGRGRLALPGPLQSSQYPLGTSKADPLLSAAWEVSSRLGGRHRQGPRSHLGRRRPVDQEQTRCAR